MYITSLAISLVDQSAVISGQSILFDSDILGNQEPGRRRRRNPAKALPAFAGSVFAVFRRVAIPTPYQSAVVMIWIYSIVCGSCVRESSFSTGFIRYSVPPCFVPTWSAGLHGATHAAPCENAVSHWFYKGFLEGSHVSTWGIQQQNRFLW